MKFFKRQGVAVILTVLIVLCSTFISINVKLQAKCDAVTDIYYDGVKLSWTDTVSSDGTVYGNEFPAMSTPINALCSIGDSVVLMAANYRVDTTALSDALKYLRLAIQYSSKDISYIGSCYSDYIQALLLTVNQLDNTGLSERHSTALEEYQAQIDEYTATVSQAAVGYNASVRRFLKSYDKYPTNVWARLTGTDFPSYFGSY